VTRLQRARRLANSDQQDIDSEETMDLWVWLVTHEGWAYFLDRNAQMIAASLALDGHPAHPVTK